MPYFPGLSPIRRDPANGFVGIGRAPSYVLDVEGEVRVKNGFYFDNNRSFFWFDSGGTARRFFLLSNSNTAYIGFVDGGWGSATVVSAGTELQFRVNGVSSPSAVARVTTAGNWFFGGLSTATALVHIDAGTTARAPLRIPHGVAPTSPQNGDIWTTTAGLYVRINGVTVGPLS